MKKKCQNDLCVALCLIAAFVLWTLLVLFIDVRAIGPQDSSVGFAALNQFVHELTGVNMTLYTVTDWLGLVPIVTVLGFAALGLAQLITRKGLLKVDRSILTLGGFYAVVFAAFIFFEVAVVNYRPILIEGRLEASYPSSTTMLAMCVMPTAAMQICERVKIGWIRRCAAIAVYAFAVFMVIGRIFSGVHWITDIIGGALFSAGLVTAYSSLVKVK